MPVYSLDELAVPLKEYPTVLAPGALVEVTFRLMHCAFPDRETRQYTNNIFSARVVTVNMLKAAPSAHRVPFSPHRPVPKPQQSPVKRGVNPSASERQNTANAFVRTTDGSGDPAETSMAEKKRKTGLQLLSDSSGDDPAKKLRVT